MSKILGKHLPIKPTVSLASGFALAARYMEILHNTFHPFQKEILNLISLEVDEIPEEVFHYQYPLQEEVLFIDSLKQQQHLAILCFNAFKMQSMYIQPGNRYPISNLSLHSRKNILMQHHTVVMSIKAFSKQQSNRSRR